MIGVQLRSLRYNTLQINEAHFFRPMLFEDPVAASWSTPNEFMVDLGEAA